MSLWEKEELRQQRKQEKKANQNMMKCLLIIILCEMGTWVFSVLNIWTFTPTYATWVIALTVGFTLIPFVLSLCISLEDWWYKYIAMFFLVISFGILAACLGFHTVLVWNLPMIFATQYRKRRFIWATALFTVLVMTLSTIYNYHYGLTDINTLIWPSGGLSHYLDENGQLLNMHLAQPQMRGLFLYFIFPRGALILLITLILSIVTKHNRTYYQIAAQLKTYREMVKKDALTGLENRNAFLEHLAALPENKKLLLFFMDLNRLKYINDNFGHEAGNVALTQVADCLHRCFDGEGKGYRLSGDEFAVIVCQPTHKPEAYRKRMQEAVRDLNRSREYPLSIAMGCSELPPDKRDPQSVTEWRREAEQTMYEDKRRDRIQLKPDGMEDFGEMIKGLVTMLDARDPATAHHSTRVTELVSAICEMLGLSQEVTDQVMIAAMLHDVGKVAIPDDILFKRQDLTENEWKVVHNHPKTGFEIISRSRSLYEPGLMVLNHHERYDGKGYPNGLSGDEIPLGSRILAIADSIDAMMWQRPYQPAYSAARCRTEIQQNLGTMYDPTIGSIVLENWGTVAAVISRQHKSYTANCQ